LEAGMHKGSAGPRSSRERIMKRLRVNARGAKKNLKPLYEVKTGYLRLS